MKLLLKLKRDSANTYLDYGEHDVEFDEAADGAQGEIIFITLKNPDREVAVSREDFLQMCGYFMGVDR